MGISPEDDAQNRKKVSRYHTMGELEEFHWIREY